MSSNGITWVGMDAHKESIKVAALFPDRIQAVEWTEATTPEAIRRLARKLRRDAPGEVRACYEAGPTGYGLQRLLEAEGVICEMIAPSLTPIRPGVHIKTDRRDARKLAELLRAGLLTEVHAPSPAMDPGVGRQLGIRRTTPLRYRSFKPDARDTHSSHERRRAPG